MSEERWQIPGSWEWVSVADVGRIVGGSTPATNVPEYFAENGIPWITPADLTGYTDTYIAKGRRDLSQIGYSSCSATLLPPGTVLFSSRAPIGYCAISANEISTNQGFKNLILEDNIDPEYVRHYLLGAKEYAESKASGTTFLELSSKRVGALALPIAPIHEQTRIVAKLDNLTSRIAATRLALERIFDLIEHHRQLVVDNAFSALELSVPLSKLVDQDRGIPYGIIKTGKNESNGIPVVRAGDIKRYRVLENQLKRVSHNIAARYRRTVLRGGEVLISIRGSVGETCVVPPSMKGNNLSREVALIPVSEDTNPAFIMYFLRSQQAKNYIEANVKGIAQTGINLRDLRQLPCPDVPRSQQQIISKHIAAALRRLDSISAQRDGAISLLPLLDNAVRTAAFHGKLVKQETDDEPVSTLLARILDHRSTTSQDPRKRRSKETTMNRSPIERISADSETWPEEGLPFEEVAKRNPMPHDQIRDALFSLLSGTTPSLRQIFNADTESIHLLRATP